VKHPLWSALVAGLLVVILVAVAIRLGGAVRSAASPSLGLITESVSPPAEGNGWGCVAYEVPGANPATLEPPDHSGDFNGRDAWAERVRATDVALTQFQVNLQGAKGQAVVLDALKVVIDEKSPTDTDTQYWYDYPCGGDFNPRRFEINLDDDAPKATAVAGRVNAKEFPALDFPLQIADDDPEVLLINASALANDVRWHLEIPWHSKDRSGTLLIQNPSSTSFETLGNERVQNSYAFDSPEGGWQQV
jgi:hypothetical protein